MQPIDSFFKRGRGPQFSDEDLDADLEKSADLPTAQVLDLIATIDDVQQLMLIRARLDRHLPEMKADQIDVSRHLAEQLIIVRSVQADALVDRDVTNAQRVSVMNGVNKALQQLIQYQQEVFNIDRSRHLETAIQLTIRDLPNGREVLQKLRETFNRLTKKDLSEPSEL